LSTRSRTSRTGALLRLFALVLLPALAGCTTVEPWERGRLAKPQMALEPNADLARLRDHAFISKEAAQGGHRGSGGGCGCN